MGREQGHLRVWVRSLYFALTLETFDYLIIIFLGHQQFHLIVKGISEPRTRSNLCLPFVGVLICEVNAV